MAGVAGIEMHLLATWMISVLCILCLGGGVGYFCRGCDTLEEGRWRGVDRSLAVFQIWVDNVSAYWDAAEVREVVKRFISSRDGMCWFTTVTHDFDGTHEVVSPVFDDIKWDRVSRAVA